MKTWLRSLDELLRGLRTSPDALARGGVDIPLRRFIPMAILLGAFYGLCMGIYASANRDPREFQQMLASTVKLPAVFMLTLIVTFPSLYVFNALLGCRLNFKSTLRLLVGAITINVIVASSFGTILLFFTATTKSYPFMVILNVILLATSGFVGLGFLLKTLHRLAVIGAAPQVNVPDPPAEDTQQTDWDGSLAECPDEAKRTEQPGLLENTTAHHPPHLLGRGSQIFRIWVVIYALVGGQMSWIMRPFIGSPDLPFEWFRDRDGNFFSAVFWTVVSLLGG